MHRVQIPRQSPYYYSISGDCSSGYDREPGTHRQQFDSAISHSGFLSLHSL